MLTGIRSKQTIFFYRQTLDKLLLNLDMNIDVLACANVHCDYMMHHKCIDDICDKLISSCITAGLEAFPCKNNRPKSNHKQVPLWYEQVEPYREKSVFWHNIWISCDRPNFGSVYEIMKQTRAQYHYAVRCAKRSETNLHKERFISKTFSYNTKEFWSHVKRFGGSNIKATASVIDGKSNASDICEVFVDKYKSVFESSPSSLSDLKLISDEVNRDLDFEEIEKVNISDMVKAFKKLHPDKADGRRGCNSNHLLHAPHRFIVCFSMLYQCMLYHGYTPDDLLHASIISIPKDKRGNLNCSSNYRGIALCNALCKVIDLWLLCKLENKLGTSELQFAFKLGHSTVMCTSVLKEIISQYRRKGSNVYVCLIDASKAFDRIHFYKLFTILKSRNISACLIRLIMDSYIRQKLCVRWKNCISQPIPILNGVKQGSIISPSLFCIYLDVLLNRLETNRAGCRIGTKFCGALAYADDLTLISPSIKGLQSMINVCETFSVEYDVLFNETKTVCIMFGKNEVTPVVYMSNVKLVWKLKVKHLGNIINSDLSDNDDINYKCGCFYQYVNRLIVLFGSLPSHIIDRLFHTYSSSFYGAQLWNLNGKFITDIYVAWQKSLRRVWNISNRTHTCLLPFISLCGVHISIHLALRFAKMFMSMIQSDNSLLSYIAKQATYSVNGTLGENYVFFLLTYKRDLANCKYDVMYTQVKNNDYHKNIKNQSHGGIIKEPCMIRDGCLQLNGLSKTEICTLIDLLCI